MYGLLNYFRAIDRLYRVDQVRRDSEPTRYGMDVAGGDDSTVIQVIEIKTIGRVVSFKWGEDGRAVPCIIYDLTRALGKPTGWNESGEFARWCRSDHIIGQLGKGRLPRVRLRPYYEESPKPVLDFRAPLEQMAYYRRRDAATELPAAVRLLAARDTRVYIQLGRPAGRAGFIFEPRLAVLAWAEEYLW